MGSLRDEVYEKLDYLSQLTEVVIGPQNELLASIPDRIEITFDMMWGMKTSVWNTRSYYIDIVRVLLSTIPLDNPHRHAAYDLEKNFEFQISPDFEVLPKTRQLVGSAFLVKKANQVDERALLEMGVRDAHRKMRQSRWASKRLRDKTITVMNALEAGKGTEWAKQINAPPAGTAISDLLRHVILENKWRIRDAQVITKIGEWIGGYMSDKDDGVGLMNLMKLKIMVDKDLPIYSIDEVKSANPA